MILWRISSHLSLDGRGGLRAPGRWHTRGRRIVYCAPNPAAALLEILVHAEIDAADIPITFRYLEIEIPDDISVETLRLDLLPANWRSSVQTTRQVGDDWLASRRTALLRVPSVIVPMTWNVLVNPHHPEAQQMRILRAHEHGIDPRLL